MASNNSDTVSTEITKTDLQSVYSDTLKKLYSNHFPFWVFPDSIQKIVIETNRCLSFPIDFISSALFFVCGLANGNTTQVKIMETWTEGTVLYLCLVGRAGTNKSHPLSWALAPILKKDKLNYNKYEREVEQYSANNSDERLPKPKWSKIVVSDYTQEALASLHKFNLRGLGVYADELAGWIKNFNRYNSGSEEQFWLSAWSGKPIIVDRRSSESISISRSFISVVGTIQNALVNEITAGNKNKNGFTDRILFVIPDQLNKEKWSESNIQESIITNWNTIVNNILGYKLELDENKDAKPKILRYDDEAFRILKEWQEKNTDRYNKQTDTALDGVLSKHDIYINRFALILQIMFDACTGTRSDKICIDAVKGAIEVSNYFIAQSVKIGKQTAREAFFSKADVRKKQFYNDLPTYFTTATAIEIGQEAKLNEKAVKRMLCNSQLFEKTKHGEYSKINL